MQRESKTRWDRENTITVDCSITRGTDPEIFQYLKEADSKSGAAKELLRLALAERTKDGNISKT